MVCGTTIPHPQRGASYPLTWFETLDWLFLLGTSAGLSGRGHPQALIGNNFSVRRAAYHRHRHLSRPGIHGHRRPRADERGRAVGALEDRLSRRFRRDAVYAATAVGFRADAPALPLDARRAARGLARAVCHHLRHSDTRHLAASGRSCSAPPLCCPSCCSRRGTAWCWADAAALPPPATALARALLPALRLLLRNGFRQHVADEARNPLEGPAVLAGTDDTKKKAGTFRTGLFSLCTAADQ